MSAHSTYKPSGIEWLGEIPNTWKVNRLKNIISKSIGGVWGEEPVGDGNDTIVIRVADFDREKASVIDSDSFTFRHISKNHLLERKLKLNDILLEKSGGGEKQLVGKAVIFDKSFNAVCANFIQRIQIKESFDKRFILHVFTSIYDGRINFPYVNQTTGIQNLDITAFLNHFIAYPCRKEEQTAIANYLDEKTNKLDLLIKNKKAQIKKLKEIRQIEINTAVTKGLDPNVTLKASGIEWLGKIPEHWEVKRLKDALKFYNNVRVPLSSEIRGSMEKRIYDYYGASGVIDKVEDYIFEGKFILIGEDGANLLARSSPLAFVAQGKFWVNNHAHILKPIKGNTVFYTYQLEMLDYTVSVTGSAQPKLTLEALGVVKLLCPPRNEQTEIANHLDEKTAKLDQLVSNLENQIKQLQEIRKIEIYNAVTGKIKVA